MVEIIAKYSFNGIYELDDLEGIQTGILDYCSDRKLIGIVKDFNDPKTKVGPRNGVDYTLLGLHFKDKDAIAYLKLIPLSSGIASVMWYLTSTAPQQNNHALNQSYNGFYQFSMIWTPSDQLQTILDNGIPTFDDLKDINIEELRKIYFNERNIDFLVRSAKDMNQIGSIDFTRLK